MMRILVFDTCFNKTYIVLKENDNIIENKVICNTDKNYHSVFLIPEIRNILRSHALMFSDIDMLGVNIGPGSFTGIRAGITIARVLAQQTNIGLVGVSALEILSKLNRRQSDTIVVTDARKNKVYFAKYNGNKVLTEPVLLDKDSFINNICSYDSVVSDTSIGSFLGSNNIRYINYEENDENIGLFLSDIVSAKIKESDNDFNWAKVKPLYIQPPSISKPKEVKNV